MKEKLREIGSKARFKFKNAVLYLIHKQRVEHIAAAFDSTLKQKLIFQRTSTHHTIDRLLKKMSERKKTKFLNHNLKVGSTLSQISSQCLITSEVDVEEEDSQSSEES